MRLSTATQAIVLCLFLAGCITCPRATSGAKYFTSPAEAVERITTMLERKDWPELARYYDLSDSPEDPARLLSGEFFYTDQQPPVAHPAGFWRYKHPFAPGFEFHSTRELDEPGVVEVTVMIEIDQGAGMIQRGIETFLMRRTKRGYQVMPHKAPPF
jgi:hypothetical protein